MFLKAAIEEAERALVLARRRFSKAVNPKGWPYGMPYTPEMREEISIALQEYIEADPRSSNQVQEAVIKVPVQS